MPAQATPFFGEVVFSDFQGFLSSRMLQVISPIWDGFEAVRYTSVPLLIRIDFRQGAVTVVGVEIFSFPACRVIVANPPDAFTSKLTR